MHYLRHLARLGVTDIHPGRAAASRTLIATLELESGQRVLELGCGAGRSLNRLARSTEISVVGIDLMREMLTAARARLRHRGNAFLLQADASRLPFADSVFDRVYAESVIGIHTSNVVRATLSEAYRVIRPGSLFVANESVWKAGLSPDLVAEINEKALADFGLRPATEEAWDIDDWLEVIRSSGFRLRSWNLLRPSPGLRDRIGTRLERHISELRVAMSFRMHGKSRAYRRKLALNRRAESAIESRLFVMERNAQTD